MENTSVNIVAQPRTLTKDVRAYFLSDEVFAQYERIVDELELADEDAVPTLSSAVFRFVAGLETLEQLQRHLQLEFLLPEPKVKQLISTVFLHVISPVAQLIPGLGDELIAWGEQTAHAGQSMTALTFVRYFIEALPQTHEPIERHRLETLLLNYLGGQKSKEDTLIFLERPPKLGGLEMDAASAQELIQAFDVQRASVDVVGEAKEVEEAKEAEEVVENVHVELGAPESALVKEDIVFSEEDEKEIQQIAEAKQSLLTQTPLGKPEDVVARICQNTSFAFTDPQLQKRCVEIVEARVREVRDAFQTREVLERAVESGGLGVEGRRLADMMESIEQAVDATRAESHRVVAQEREAANVKKQEAKEQRKQLEEKETQMLAKRYVQTTGKVPTEAVSPVAPALSRASLALSSHMQLQQQQSKIDTDKVRAAVEKSTEKKSSPSVSVSKPRVQDIRTAPRLAGPIEELQAMGLIEFRRLSKDPQQAIDRMKDMINLLDDQGYERRVEGVRALRSSPLMRAYGSITQKALMSGQTVDHVLAQDAAGLKKEEYQALMRLNADLRF